MKYYEVDFEVGDRVSVYGNRGTLIWSDSNGCLVEFDNEALGTRRYDCIELNGTSVGSRINKKRASRAPAKRGRVKNG